MRLPDAVSSFVHAPDYFQDHILYKFLEVHAGGLLGQNVPPLTGWVVDRQQARQAVNAVDDQTEMAALV